MEEVEYCDPFDGKKYDYWMKLEHAGRYEFAKNFISENLKNSNIADISCATGYGAELLASVCAHVDGYDLRSEYLAKAQKRKIKNASFYQIDFNKEVLKNRKYDAVISFETIEHIENTDNFLKSMQNIVKKNGFLIISVPNPKYEQLDENGNIIYKYHKHIFSKEQIIILLTKFNFKIERILGQSLCNMIVSNFHNLRHERKEIFDKKLLNKYNYGKKAILMNLYLYSYPDEILVDDSYSFVFVCKKV